MYGVEYVFTQSSSYLSEVNVAIFFHVLLHELNELFDLFFGESYCV